MAVERTHFARILQLPDVLLPGATGPVGATGPAGPQGEAATPGSQGPTGATGPASELGPTGEAQLTGPTGPRGVTGPVDNEGGTGTQGYWGEWGPDGPDGPVGATGRTGAQGLSANPRGVTGATGPVGAGSVGGLQVPFFVDPETYLTTPQIPVGQGNTVSWAYREFYASTIYLVPIFVPYPRTYTELVMDSYQERYETVGYRVGVYDCNELMQPTVPLFDSGIIRPIGKGRMAVAMNLPLQNKPYFLGLMVTDTHRFRCFAADEIAMSLGWRSYPAAADGWKFEIVALQTSYFNYSWVVGFIDFTNRAAELLPGNFLFMAGIR